MSNSELFLLRNKLLKNSFSEFKKILLAQKTLDPTLLTNLFLLVYENESLRKNGFQYLTFFAQYSVDIVHVQITDRRRLLEDLCFCGKADDIRQLSTIMINIHEDLERYDLEKLITLTLEGKNSSDNTVATISELLNIKKYLANGGQFKVSNQSTMLVLYALHKDLFLPALELLKNSIGSLGKESEELFALSECKINKRESENLYKFIQIYLEKSKCNPRHMDRKGRNFIQYLAKEHHNNVEQIVKEFERSNQKIQKHIRRSQNKVRSSLGPGQNVKQYSNQPLHVSSKEKLTINIQNMDDELSIQRQAGRIYEKHINEKQKYYRYQKNQRKQQQSSPRVGIIKSDELRYYLEEDINYQVNKLQEENKRCRPYYNEIINKLKERLCGPLMIDLQVFGSVETALCLPQSDIDIIILPKQPNQQKYPFQLLQNIQQLLEDMNEQILSVKLIKSATVPIIKVVCTQKYLGKRIDFTYRDDNHNGMEAVKLVCSYKQEYPQLQSLIFVLKKFIYASNLSQPYLGGLSSYGLILMIVAYIQQEYKLHEIQKKQEPLKTSDLLIGFLKFYGFKMNYIMKSIEICDRKKQSEWQKYTGCLSRYTDPTNPIIDLQPKLVVIDPLNKENNIGRSTHKIRHIQMAFEIAYISIHTFKQCGKKRRCQSFRRIAKCPADVRYADQQRPCCILKRMFACTQKFIKE